MMNHQKKIEVSHKVTLAFSCIFFAILVFLFLHQDTWVDSGIHTNETIGYSENLWTLYKGELIEESNIELPRFMKLEQKKLYTLTTRITYDGDQDESPYGFLHVDHMFCRVLLDGEELFKYMPEDIEKLDYSKSPGFIYKSFPMPRDCKGKELKIQLLAPLGENVEYGLPDLTFGDYTSMLRASINRDAPHDLMMLFCAMLGIVFIILSALTLHGSNYREGLSIGIFCILFAAYMITECRANAFYIGNPYALYLINYIPLLFLPISLMCFMRERLPERHQKIWNVVVSVALIFAVTLLSLHFTGIFDLKEAVSYIHMASFIDLTIIISMMFTMKDKLRRRALLFQSFFLIVGMLLDILIYRFHWKMGSNDATFVIMGVMIFLVIEVIHIWKMGITIYKESIHGQLYRQMAYVDELTDIGNRRAYNEEINNIISGDRKYQSMIVSSIDVNKLKYVNDNFGHGEGDILISSAARIMKTMVGDTGLVFRTGGDEFAIFFYDIDEERHHRIIEEIRKEIAIFNKTSPYILSLAAGHVHLEDHRILEALQEADHKMYEDKAKKHALRD